MAGNRGRAHLDVSASPPRRARLPPALRSREADLAWSPMSPVRSDYLERQIAQMVEALAALLKLRRERKLEEATLLLQRTCREVLGMEYGALTLVDATSAAQLLGTPERIRVLAQLVTEDAAQREVQGLEEKALELK